MKNLALAASALSLLLSACSTESGAAPDAEVGTTEEAISIAQCRKPENRGNDACMVSAVVTGTFAGEVDPNVVGDTCIVFVRLIGSDRTWGLLEDFDVCANANKYERQEAAPVRFHKGRMTSVASSAARAELKSLASDATFYAFDGSLEDVDVPDNAFTLQCRPKGAPCARSGDIGYCVGAVTIRQVGDDHVAVTIQEGTRVSSRRTTYVPRSPSVGGRSDDGALPESLSASLDADHWIELELDEDDLSKMKGTFNFNEAVRFPGEFESIDLECDGTL